MVREMSRVVWSGTTQLRPAVGMRVSAPIEIPAGTLPETGLRQGSSNVASGRVGGLAFPRAPASNAAKQVEAQAHADQQGMNREYWKAMPRNQCGGLSWVFWAVNRDLPQCGSLISGRRRTAAGRPARHLLVQTSGSGTA
jgi:hypothetical protein